MADFSIKFSGDGVHVSGDTVSLDKSKGYLMEVVPGEITPPPDPGPVDPDEPEQGDLRGWYDYLAGARLYHHPGDEWLSEDSGLLSDVSGWSVVKDRGTAVTVQPGSIKFSNAQVQARIVQHPLKKLVPAGSTVRVWVRVPELNGGRVLVKVGGQITKTIKQAGWWSGTARINTSANTIELVNTNGGATISEVAVDVVNPATEKLDIIVLAGQSNMVGASSGPGTDFALDMPHPKVLAMSGSTYSAVSAIAGQIDFAHAHMQHRSLNQSGLGPGLSLGRYYADHHLAPDRKVLLIAAAKGSTKLVGNAAPWNPDGTDGSLTDWAIEKAQEAVALNPDENRIVGVVWCQGESDYGSGNQALYPAAFRALVREFRQELSAPDLPFVILGLNPNAISANATSMIALQESLADGGANGIAGVIHSGWNPHWGDGTKTNPSNDLDTVHFGADANRIRGVQAAIDLFG